MEQFLSYGSIGVGLASLLLAVKLIHSEQKLTEPRKSMLGLIYTVMVFGLVITTFGFLNESRESNANEESLPSFSIANGTFEKSGDGKILVGLDEVKIGLNDNIYADIRVGLYPNVKEVYSLQVNQGYSDVFSINGNEYTFLVKNISESGNLITISWGRP